MVDLKLTLGRLALKNPVLVASGTFGYVREMARFVRLERLGGVIPKTVTFQPPAGNPTPRTVETASGLLNAIGLDNDGIDHFIDASPAVSPHGRHGGDRQHRRRGRRPVRGDGRDARRRAGPGGDRAEHLVPERQPRARPGDRRRRGGQAGAAGPRRLPAADHRQADAERDRHRADRRGGGRRRGRRRQPDQHVPRHGRRLAAAARPILAYDVGGLSGPAIKPIALRMVWDVARALPGLPIIGIGGIATADDALEFLVAGASAIQVGTATFYDPTASERLLDDLTARLDEAGDDRTSARSSERCGPIGVSAT